MKKLFTDYRKYHVVSGKLTTIHQQKTLLARFKVHADTIYILPTTQMIIMAETAAEDTEDKNIIVIFRNKIVPQGLSAFGISFNLVKKEVDANTEANEWSLATLS